MCVCTRVRAAGDPGVLHVVTVVLLPVAMATLLQEELISCALHSIQQDRAGPLTEVSPGPGRGHTPTTHTHHHLIRCVCVCHVINPLALICKQVLGAQSTRDL